MWSNSLRYGACGVGDGERDVRFGLHGVRRRGGHRECNISRVVILRFLTQLHTYKRSTAVELVISTIIMSAS